MRLNPSVTEVARNFADYINRVAFRGEHFTLMRGGKPVAELRPVPAGKRLGELSALLASLPQLSPEDVSALAEDLDLARTELSEQPLQDPWAS
jgi:antitoxin (DNA-binding transcriptional repressor) of toxin-antitoxin stability system